MTAAWNAEDGLRTTGGLLRVDAAVYDVAVSPGGRRLVTWQTSDGLFARVDGDAPQRVADGEALEVESDVGDDGAALTAYRDARSGGIAVVDRLGAGPWTTPRGVTGGRTVEVEPSDSPRTVFAALAPDGRAVVAWASASAWGGRVYAAVGRAGGAWDPAAALSFPGWLAGPEEATVDAAGDPLVLWTEQAGGYKGAKAVSATAEPGPLGAELALPRRLPATDDGSFTVVAKARCAKACEVGLNTGLGVRRTLPAGEATTFRVKAGDVRLLYPRSLRRVRIALSASDRLGHEHLVERTFRVRVVRRPLRSFKVGPAYDFAMGSRAGNRAVGRLVNELLEGLASGRLRSERDLIRRYKTGARAIDRCCGPVFDTAVGDAIYEVILVPFALKGFSAEAVLGS